MVMQAAFFKLSGVLPEDVAVEKLKEAIVKDYGHKGEEIVNMNYAAVDAGMTAAHKVDYPKEWANLTETESHEIEGAPAFINNILVPMTRQEGVDLPVSAFVGMEDGTFMSGTSRY